MKGYGWIAVVVVALVGAAAVAVKAAADEKMALEAVPQKLKDVAVAAVPGLVLEKAEREIEKGVVVYDLEGHAGGVRYEVEVTADGKVLEVEKGDDEGDGKDDKDDDKDDDDK
jgi:hypothetical protein